MSVQTVWPEVIDFFPGLPIRVASSDVSLSGDGGLLLFRQLDERLGLTHDFVAALDDPRDPALRQHSFLEMTRQRVYGILADYEDQNDADFLRADPIFKLLCGRRPDEPDLASQPTLSRFENSISIASLKRQRQVLVEQFIASFSQPPRHLTFDLDAVDDPAHGQQQLTFWHNYYDQNQYLPLILTCADNDLIASLSLRHGSAHAALGADDDLEYVVSRVRAAWPDVVIYVRGDAAFGIPTMYQVCERLRLFYTFGLTANAVLKRQTQELLDQAIAAWEAERQQARLQERAAQPTRLFSGFWYQAGTWERPRWVVVKAEANEQGSQRRFVVSNRPGAPLLPGPTYDEYVQRGESENRHKEFKCDLHMDRLSDHRFCANYFRLYLHGLAMNLVVRMRQLVKLPEPVTEPTAEVPSEAAVGEQRKRQFNQRRQRDVLGEGQPQTWREHVIKVAVRVISSSRRVVIELSSVWPYLEEFQQLMQRLWAALAVPPIDIKEI
jgi:Transposase DDE domain group 1